MKALKTVLPVFALVIISSCSKDFLDTRPVGRVLEVNYYQNEEQAFEALMSVYDVLQWNDQHGYTMFRFLQNVASDETHAGGSDASDQPSWVAYDSFTLTPNLGPQRGFWRKGYKGIYRANLYLEKIEQIEDASLNFKERTSAEARFLRAKFYFDLVRLFGRIPFIDHTLGASEYYEIDQVSPEKVYELIIDDLESAIEVLPETVNSVNTGRATKGAAQALLARVYLFKNDLSDMAAVAALCEDIIQSGNYSLLPNYGDIWTREGEWSSESVFEITYSENSESGWGSFGWGGGEGNVGVQFIGMRDYNGPEFATGWGFCPVSQDLEEFMSNDPRYLHTIIDADAIPGGEYTPGYQNTGYFIRKYAPLTANLAANGDAALNWGNNIREIRYADVLLMAAEGLVRSGGSEASARNYLNQVRNRVGLPSLNSSGSDLLDDIYEERRLELATEGHRFFDLIRTGEASSVLSPKGFISGIHEVLPIPQQEIDASQGVLTQNSGY